MKKSAEETQETMEETPEEAITDNERLAMLLSNYRAGGGNSAGSKEALALLLELIVKKLIGA